MLRRILQFTSACAATALLLTSVAGGALAGSVVTTRYVDDDGMAAGNGCDGTLPVPTSIQDAVDVANAGDTIRVCPGTYYGRLDIAKDRLTVTSVNPWKATLRVDPATMTTNTELVYMHDAERMKLRWMRLVIPTEAPCTDGITAVATDHANLVQIRANHIELDGPADGECGITEGIRLSYSDGSRAVYNRIGDFRQDGIMALYSSDSRIAGNTVKFSHAATPEQRLTFLAGIAVFGSTRAYVGGNYVRGHASSNVNELLAQGIRVVTIDASELGPTLRGNHFNDLETAIVLGENSPFATILSTVTFNTGTVGVRAGIVVAFAYFGDIGRNRFSASGVGIQVNGGQLNNIHDNRFVGPSDPDCVDYTTGPGTQGTANTWLDNLGDTSSPAGICDTAS
jgi:hypothetical protein